MPDLVGSVNHFDIKRKAHGLSRKSTEQTWNPFRHVSWDNRPSKRSTWDGANLEAQREVPSRAAEDAETEEPIHHVQSEPAPRDSDTVRSLSKDTRTGSGSGETMFENKKEQEAADTGLRNRKTDAAGAQDRSPPDEEEREKPKKQKSGLIRHVEPKQPFTVANQLQRTLLCSWINILILAAPAGIAISYVNVSKIAVFVVNFIAIIPLAAMLGFATEEIALRTGESLGGLLNATFGNAVELIVAIIALAENKPLIVQTSLIGSILSNLLLVMGFCFFFGGLRRPEQYFNTTVAQTAASLLALAVASVIVPSVFDKNDGTNNPTHVAQLSRGTAVILLIIYASYLFFQLKTHSAVFNEESQKVAAKPWSRGGLKEGALGRGLAGAGARMAQTGVRDHDERAELSRIMMQRPKEDEDDDEEEDPQLHFLVAVGTLAGSTVLIAFCAEAMVSSIDAVTKASGISEEFVGLILLPIVGNAAEHATAVTVAIKDKMDLAIGVAVGSSMQVALFLIPLLVIIGWGMGKDDMTMSFDLFQVAVLFVAVLLVNYLISDGKSHWLEGLQLICLYAIIAVCSWWYPAENVAG
ncbi:Vacuolar calcium ion transporter [Colletotrichum siamense]|uniref:Vacuolar calcium ion transporter n=1 Tax=Colletotrichum siamense TaxID=690259 RepID=A0A9P5EFD3_COLSI|nr:Vacuolar calcium ion transporter [Colletotrichum siamense]KAF4851625.1 Vacuolar calcium ion transporter [Colletotrichum siamense]KAI8263072.1 Vacuolar calcium ion transporter [Colletotrichum sp. SAR11_239]